MAVACDNAHHDIVNFTSAGRKLRSVAGTDLRSQKSAWAVDFCVNLMFCKGWDESVWINHEYLGLAKAGRGHCFHNLSEYSLRFGRRLLAVFQFQKHRVFQKYKFWINATTARHLLHLDVPIPESTSFQERRLQSKEVPSISMTCICFPSVSSASAARAPAFVS